MRELSNNGPSVLSEYHKLFYFLINYLTRTFYKFLFNIIPLENDQKLCQNKLFLLNFNNFKNKKNLRNFLTTFLNFLKSHYFIRFFL